MSPEGPGGLRGWRLRVRQLRRETHALYLACRDPRTPWYAKALAACVVAYALSPVDLIPDFIPLVGYLDDLLLVPLGLALAIKMIPPEVMSASRERAADTHLTNAPGAKYVAAFIVLAWIAAGAWGIIRLSGALGWG